MTHKLAFLLTVLLFAAAVAPAQNRQLQRRLTVDDGLPSNTVRNMVQDQKGFLWLGTDNGLCRYDGVEVRTFRIPGNGINQFIMSLRADGDSLVVSTESGVFSFTPRTEQFRRLRGEKTEQTGRGDRLQTRDGRLWIGTWEQGLMLMSADGRPEQVLSPQRDHLGFHIHKLFEYDDRYLLIGCDEGLVAYDRRERRATLWDAPKFVYSMVLDSEGGLWVGTFYNGVYYMSSVSNRFERHEGHVISRFCEDSKGRLWVASDDAGLICLVDGVETDYAGREVLSRENVHEVIYDDYEDYDCLWIGTYSGGVYRLKDGQLRHYTTSDGLNDNSSYAMLIDGRHRLWVATMDGLCLYNELNDRFELIRKFDGMVISMALAPDGMRLWLATQGAGLYAFNNKKWTQYKHTDDKHSLSNDEVNGILVSRSGHLWVATQGGLCLYQPKTDNFRQVNDLPVSSLVEAATERDLWLGTAKGVLKVSQRTGESVAFTREDGLVGLQFQPNAGYRDSKGYIYFGTVNGYSRFLPSAIKTNTVQPPVYITGLEVFSRSVEVGEKLLPLSTVDGESLQLSYSDRMFSLSYAALSYVSPAKNQYAYRLEGFDRDWNYVGSQTKATYTNLPPGTYTFKVKATNNDGVWSDGEATLKIVVSPPFWWSWPARLFYLLLVLGAIWYYVRFRLRRAEREHRQAIRRLSEAKEQEAREARLNFFTTIAHEIRTPVSLIIGPLEKLRGSMGPDEDGMGKVSAAELRTSLDVIDRNAQRLLNLVNQLLDFRKVEKRAAPMRFAPQNIGQLLRCVCERFAPTFAQNGKAFSVDYPDEHFTAIVDAEAVTKVVSNLLTNASKYTKTKVEVRCYEEPDGSRFRIEVADDGVGIRPDDRERIFQPFYQAADNKPGTGIGLSIVKDIVDQHGGTVSVESELGRGATFIVTLPTSQAVQEPVAEALPIAAAEDTPVTVGTPSAATRQMLVVDDNEDMVDFLTRHFSGQYRVLTAQDGIEALAKLADNEVDLIVSDWMMPRMDGAELCRRVRQNPLTSHIAFVMLTAKTDNSSKVQGMGVGADAYIEKPFSIQYLEGVIRNMLEMRRRLRERFATEPLEPVTQIASNETDNDFLVRMNRLIEENFANPDLNVNFLAEQLAISRSGLFAKIKTLADVTPNEMIQIVRLKRAAQMLRDPERQISDVCYTVGFSSPSYFSKCFQKQFGMTPTEFRSKM